MKSEKEMIMSDARLVLPAGRYYVGDVSGVSRPYVAIPARASVFYSDCSGVEVEIAGGASSCYVDDEAFGVFGVVEFASVSGPFGFDEFSAGEFGCFEIAEPTEVIYNFDYLEIVGVMTFSFARDCGLRFTSTEDEFESVTE